MTRKQAVYQAIAILEEGENNQEICSKLYELLTELPMTHWSDKTVFDAFDQYILEHQCLPTKSDISRNPRLPTHSTIKNRFGLTLEEFYEKYYKHYIRKCNSRRYHYHNADYWIDNFKEQYEKYNHPIQRQYDSLRDKDTPCSRHVIRISGYNNWNELLVNCGFKVMGQNHNSTITKQRDRPKYKINLSHNEELNLKQVSQINEDLGHMIKENDYGKKTKRCVRKNNRSGEQNNPKRKRK